MEAFSRFEYHGILLWNLQTIEIPGGRKASSLFREQSSLS